MIVTCPKCEARYAVDPLAIGPAGRTVQCARCDNRWFQRVESPPPPPDLLIRPSPRTTALPVPVEPKVASPWGKRLAIAAAVVIVLGAAGAGAYFYRSQLVGYAEMAMARFNISLPSIPNPLKYFQSSTASRPATPPARAAAPATPSPSPAPAQSTSAQPSPPTPAPAAASEKTAPRLDPPSSPAQLEVDLTASRIELVDGRYVVRGEVANHGGAPGTTSKLTVVFKKNNDVLTTKTYPLTLGPIAPGDRASFSQALDGPPPGATDIVPSVE
jgi:predicted Zn finger-like uncharacterized protein